MKYYVLVVGGYLRVGAIVQVLAHLVQVLDDLDAEQMSHRG